MIRERESQALPGLLMVVVMLLLTAMWPAFLKRAAEAQSPPQILLAALAAVVLAIMWKGFVLVQPNQGKVLQLFGRYTGTIKQAGLWYTNPFYTGKAVSLRIRNFETTKLKVNDRHSNPIEIAAVVVWQVVDSAEAMFEVDNYDEYVRVQSEAALRGMANQYAYDAHAEGELSLSGSGPEVSEKLKGELQERLAKAGVRVLEARISHLAYAPEIAGVMLRRQQANAVIAARQKIVEGAVGMVEQALQALSAKQIVRLDEERKATMVSNLLVVLCSEQATQPVVNAGSLY